MVRGVSAPSATTDTAIVAVNPSAPDPAVVARAGDVLAGGGVIAFPTDTLYGIGCLFGRPEAKARIQALRRIDASKRPFTFMLPDLGALPHYAVINQLAFRIMSRIFPGPYCVELLPTPRAMGDSAGGAVPGERPTIGVRIPASPFCERLLWQLRRPLLTVTAKSPAGAPLTTAHAIAETYGAALDLVVDGGEQDGLPSTVVSLVDDWVAVLREGRGPTSAVLPASGQLAKA
jgi:tRNA threonylcarbamoyl adenosine modification protein (Sua5/YciO/YrdC/YwlC family)